MSITTYATLTSAVADWLNRDDLTDQVPTFIQMGESELRRRLQGAHLETGTVALDSGLVTLPADVGAVQDVFLEANSRTYVLSQTDIAGVIMQRGGIAAQPTHYAVGQGELWLGPVPDQTYTGTLVYEPFLALSDTQTTNWALSEAPDGYLYAALIAASPYLKDDVRVPLWQERLDRVIRDVKVASDRKRYGGRMQMPQPRTFG